MTGRKSVDKDSLRKNQVPETGVTRKTDLLPNEGRAR